MSHLRLLFVSWSTVGGSGQSQRQLAAQLADRGHEVQFLVHDRRSARVMRAAYGQLSDLSARLDERAAGRAVGWLRDRPGQRMRVSEVDGFTHHWTPLPQNALRSVVESFPPDAVIVSSVDRWVWRRIHDVCGSRGIPTVLYLREEASLDHLGTGSIPSLLVANTPSLAARMEERGFSCAFVPSVVDVSATATESSRTSALAINPIPLKGSDTVWELARRLPEVPFVVQEGWPLRGPQLEDVLRRSAALPNVEFRRTTEPGPGLYGDARVLLAPYLVDSRPRVVLEAQANGIPVIASDVPALVDAIGDGGLVASVDSDDSLDQWVEAVRSLWDDGALYARLSEAARSHAKRPEVRPESIGEEFERLVHGIVEGHLVPRDSDDDTRPIATKDSV
ncbi:MAG: glycosyltransferase [Knoellia sp.]